MDSSDLLKRPERWASVLGWATLAGLEFGLLGPFGSYESDVFRRMAYWTGLFWIGSLLLWPAMVAALRAGRRRGFPPLFCFFAAVIVTSVPLALLGAIQTYVFWPRRAAAMSMFDWYGLTIMVALPAMAALTWIEMGRSRPSSWLARSRAGLADASQSALTGPDHLADAFSPARSAALPAHLLEIALCLQMEDHHVRVHLPGRSYLHHAALRDVMAEIDEERGMQVHRSWWVDRRAVVRWERDGRSVVLLLSNGLRVPVARNRIVHLRERGWLDEPASAA
ncbi:LytTR family DNA-binding domain-containing protein [Rhizorhabdus sp.]|uniref:LytTR family DNA-binding domain-containing protein n=1 Tax=Rhizorhabdus sp. TaxID=1968843 RepID=UPI001B48CBC8|nr:LytTR family DNA-binding domain-containing protein [Rhizorhabdus sp.]MBP8231905.1 LytTR family transcriptional regulator [Rhizorhabdus sp.]